jgi:hypothetical protein
MLFFDFKYSQQIDELANKKLFIESLSKDERIYFFQPPSEEVYLQIISFCADRIKLLSRYPRYFFAQKDIFWPMCSSFRRGSILKTE